MASADDYVEVDFKLVTTYLPVLSLIFRALSLIAIVESLSLLRVGSSTLVAATGTLVYWDAHLHRTSQLSVACGGLLPVSGAVLVARLLVRPGEGVVTPPCTGWEAFLLAWVFDVAWAVTSSFHLTATVVRPVYTHRLMPVLWSALAVAKVWALCEPMPSYELPFRATLFYISSMLVLYASPFLPDVDRNVHRMTTPHLNLHLLLVQPYILVASVLVFALVLARAFGKVHEGASDWGGGTGKFTTVVLDALPPRKESTRMATTHVSADEAGLLEQLRLAKAMAQAT